MKVRIIKQGDQVFTYDGEDENSLRQALLHDATGIPGGDVYDITDLDRSDMDADEYLIATEDDGTPVWSGWLGGVTGPAPASIAGDVEVDMHRWYAVISHGGNVVAVIGHNDSGVGRYESVEAWEAANS